MSEPQDDQPLLTIGAYVRMFVEVDVPIPPGFDVTDREAVQDLWDEFHDYNGDGTEILEITIDHDKVQALHEFDRDEQYTDAHRAADADHTVVPDAAEANCTVCGLAYDGIGKHGYGA